MVIVEWMVGAAVLLLLLTILYYVVTFSLSMFEWIGAEFLIIIGVLITFCVAAYFIGKWLLIILA